MVKMYNYRLSLFVNDRDVAGNIESNLKLDSNHVAKTEKEARLALFNEMETIAKSHISNYFVANFTINNSLEKYHIINGKIHLWSTYEIIDYDLYQIDCGMHSFFKVE